MKLESIYTCLTPSPPVHAPGLNILYNIIKYIHTTHVLYTYYYNII